MSSKSPSRTPGSARKARRALSKETSRRPFPARTSRVEARESSSPEMSSLRSMTHTASAGCRRWWPGSRDGVAAKPAIGRGASDEEGGEDPRASDPTGVEELSRRGRTNLRCAATGLPPVAPETRRGRLQSRAKCRNPWQRRQRRGSLQVATRCEYERQFKHLSLKHAGKGSDGNSTRAGTSQPRRGDRPRRGDNTRRLPSESGDEALA